MSFAAVVALIAAWEMAAAVAPAPARARRASQASLGVAAGAGFAASLATTLIASVATGAFAAYHFNRLSLLGVVANLLGVPLTGFWIMPWGLLAMLLMPLGLERFALVPMGWGVEGLDAIARHVADWPQAAMLVPSLPGASLWLLTVGGLWLCLWRRRWRFAGLPVAIGGLLLAPPPTPDLLMSEDGRVLGLRDERGMVHIASARTDRFVSDAWARRSGQEGAKRWTVSADAAGRRPRLQHRALPLAQGAVAHRAGERRPKAGRGLRQRRHRLVDRRCAGPLPRPAAGDRSPRCLARGRPGTVARRSGRAARDRQRTTRRSAVGPQQLGAPSGTGQGAWRVAAAHGRR